MTDRRFDRIADAYLAPGPIVLPDRVLDAAFEEVHRTRQRRAPWREPWRFLPMNTFAKVAVAAVAVIAVGYLGLAVLAPSASGPGGAPSVAPSASASPSFAPFTSERNGFSITYPATWSTNAATKPWTSGFVDFESPSGDVLFRPTNPGNLWIAVASQPLGDRTPAAWEADVWQYLVDDDPVTADCASAATPVTVDGATGVLGCGLALVTDGGRGYYVLLYTSGDDPSLDTQYDEAWFRSVLATMELHPEDAVD